MSIRIRKATAPGRDNPLLERIELIAQQVGCVGFTANREGLAAINHEIDEKTGRLFGLPVFLVLPQKERVNAFWSARDLDEYLARFRLRKPNP